MEYRLELVVVPVSDVDRAKAFYEPFHFGAEGMTPGPDPARQSYNSFMQFPDPDGNVWLVQEVHRAADGSAS